MAGLSCVPQVAASDYSVMENIAEQTSMNNLLSGPVLMVGLPLIAILTCVLLKNPAPLTLLLYLAIPLIASVTSVVAEYDRSYSIFSRDFISAVIATYILTLFIFGYVAPFVGAIARWALVQFSRRSDPRRGLLLVASTIAGASFGAVLLVSLALSAERDPNAPGDAYYALYNWGITGAVSGAVSGLLVAAYSQPDTSRKESVPVSN